MTAILYWSGFHWIGLGVSVVYIMLVLGTIGGVIVEKVRGREAKPPH